MSAPSDLVSRLFPNRLSPAPARPPAPDPQALPPAVSDAQAQLQAHIEAEQAQLAARWGTASARERQEMLTSLAQTKNAEALMSARVVVPGDPLAAKHNNLIMSAARDVTNTSVKLAGGVFSAERSALVQRLYPIFLERIAEAEAARAAEEAQRAAKTIDLEPEGD